MRENAATKARRLLVEGRLRVLSVDESAGTARAECRGDSGAVYDVGRLSGSGWFCSCPAFSRCAHVRALQHVVVLEPREGLR
jgi:hypothetical protein